MIFTHPLLFPIITALFSVSFLKIKKHWKQRIAVALMIQGKVFILKSHVVKHVI